MTDYSKITADIVRGPEIGRLYVEASPFITIGARMAYRELAGQLERQFHQMTDVDGIAVQFQPEDPYPDASAMVYDVETYGRLRVYATPQDQRHPLLGRHGNDLLRAVHDYYGHHGAGFGASVDFSRHGEEAAWVRHSRMFSGLAQRAMTSETRGQNSAFIWINGGREFPEQKAVLLPDWVSRIPERWQ